MLKKSDLLKELYYAKYQRESDGQWEYTTYFLKINFRPSDDFNLIHSLQAREEYNERGPYSWIPVSEIKAAILRYRKGERKINLPEEYLPSCSGSKYYWDVFLKSMDEALRRGMLNW